MTKKHASTLYQWRGRDSGGNLRRGELPAANAQLVKSYLNKQGIVPMSVKTKARPLVSSKGRITPAHIAAFSRQTATMLKAGMPLSKALGVIADGIQKPQSLRQMVEAIRDEVDGGHAFSQALAQHPQYFSDLYLALVRAGEAGGVLDDSMQKIAAQGEKAAAIKRKVKKATLYPLMVVGVAVVVCVLLLIYVLPVFEQFFADFGAQLPWLTQVVVELSRALRDGGGWLLLAIFLLGLGGFYAQKRHRGLRRRLEQTALRLPVLGGILKLAAMARFARTLSILFDAGVPLVKALETTAPATGNSIYQRATNRIAKDVENGTQLHFAMQNTARFEPFAVQMVEVGEASGQLSEMLANVADTYEARLDYRLEHLTTLLEPFIIIFLALIVGTLVVAMYLPIFLLGDAVG